VPPVPNIQPCGHKPDQERIAYPEALREALERYHDDSATSDLLLLMAWENRPTSNLGTVLRIAQIRRANPVWRQNYPPAETDAGTRRDRAPSGRLDDSEAEVLRGGDRRVPAHAACLTLCSACWRSFRSTDAGCSSMNRNAVGLRYHLFRNYGSEGG
jgi:hypothetical protein